MLKGFLFGIGFMIAVFFGLVVVGSVGVWQLSKTWEELYTRYHRDENAESRSKPNLLPAETVQTTAALGKPQAVSSKEPASSAADVDDVEDLMFGRNAVNRCDLSDTNFEKCVATQYGDIDPQMPNVEIYRECILVNYEGSAQGVVEACSVPLTTWRQSPTFQAEWDKLMATDRAVRDIILTYNVAKKTRS